MNKATLAFAATLAASLTVPACASPPGHTWYWLNFDTGQCETGRGIHASPQAFHEAVRSEGIADLINTSKGEDGTIRFVLIEFRLLTSGDVGVAFFPSHDLCDAARLGFQADGRLPGSAALR